MSKKIRVFVFIICLTKLVVYLVGCSQDIIDTTNLTSRMRHSTIAFNTVSTLLVYSDFSNEDNVRRFNEAWQQTLDILEELDSTLSPTSPYSYVTKFNSLAYRESINISYHMANVIQIAKDLYGYTDGLFDLTVHPLVDLWGLSPRFNVRNFVMSKPFDREAGRYQLPDIEYIEAFLQLVNFDGIELNGCKDYGFTLTKNIRPIVINGYKFNASLDLGAILKGYAVDLVLLILESHGFEFGFFSCGGSSIVMLNGMDYIYDDEFLFEIGLRRPRAGNTHTSSFAIVKTANHTISTSGDWDNYFFVEGVRYSHIFDPRTGWPINTPVSYDKKQQGLVSVTVMGSNNISFVGTKTEIFSTALIIMSLAEAIEFMYNYLADYKVVLVHYDNRDSSINVITNICERFIEILDDAYVKS